MKQLWIAGQSGNKQGRPKGSRYSILTTKGRIERFLSKNMSATALQKLYLKLSPRDQYDMLIQLLPYVASKQSGGLESMSEAEVNRLYDEVMKKINEDHAKAS